MAKKSRAAVGNNPRLDWEQVEWWELGRLIPYPQNTKAHPPEQVTELANAIREFGWDVPIVVDEDGVILKGHGRRLSALELQLAKVPVIVRVGLSEEEKRAIRISDNKLSESDWLDDFLLEELKFLKAADFDLKLTGFSDDEFQAMIGASGPGNGRQGTDDEGAVSRQKQQADAGELVLRVELGEIWQLGRHRIACADSTIEANVRQLLGDRFGTVGMIWTDPPFGIDLKPQRGLTQAIANDKQWEAKDLWQAFIPVAFAAMRDNTVAFFCQGWSELDWTLPIVRKFFKTKSKIVWYKTQWGIGYYLRPQHEDILYCWKGEPKKPETAISDVWEIARLNAPEHSCEKPVDLPKKAMEFASLPTDLIYDPFLGVAPSIIAAEQLEGDRTVYGFELNPGYCTIILNRWESFTGETAQRIGSID